MKLIVGLGNPGPRYAGTRHNAGAMAVDRLAARHGLSGAKGKFHASVLEGRIGQRAVMLMKPQTYMNHSGLAVGEAARFYKLAPADMLVVVDDTALPVGLIRLRSGGGSGGHNGLEDIRRALGTDDYPRLRIGIGEPVVDGHRVPQADYVLSPFSEAEREAVAPALEEAADAAACWLERGIEAAMSRFNRRVEGGKGAGDAGGPEKDAEQHNGSVSR